MYSGLVSIVIPTFNKRDLLGSTLASVINQTYRNLEILLVDNGSTDGTRLLIQSYLDHSPEILRLVEMKENLGPSGARNAGILAAKGKYIFLLDGDDLLMPKKVETQVSYMELNEGVGLSLTPYFIYSASKRLPLRLVSELDPLKLVRGWIGMSDFGGLVESTGCIRRSDLDSTLLFDLTLMGSEGLDFTMKWLDRFPIAVVNDPLTIYRLSSNQLHRNVSAIDENVTRITKKYVSPQKEKSMLLKQQAAFFRLDKIRYRSKSYIALYLLFSLFSFNTLNIKMAFWITSRNLKAALKGFLYRSKLQSAFAVLAGNNEFMG